MRGTRHHAPPPGFVKATDAPSRLHEILCRYGDPSSFIGASRQNWYKSRLVDALDSWVDGRNRYYREADLHALAEWLVKRRGAIALQWRPEDTPLNPDWARYPADAAEAWEEYETACPQCDRIALRDGPDGQRVWCPTHGVLD